MRIEDYIPEGREHAVSRWVTSNLGELLDYLRESTHRAQSQYLNDAPIRRLALHLSGEETVNVRAYTRRVRKQEGIEGQEKWEV